MLVPTKHLNEQRALLRVGADILLLLNESKTVSKLWDDIKQQKNTTKGTTTLTYNWFVLALDLLYALYAIDFEQGRIRKVRS